MRPRRSRPKAPLAAEPGNSRPSVTRRICVALVSACVRRDVVASRPCFTSHASTSASSVPLPAPSGHVGRGRRLLTPSVTPPRWRDRVAEASWCPTGGPGWPARGPGDAPQQLAGFGSCGDYSEPGVMPWPGAWAQVDTRRAPGTAGRRARVRGRSQAGSQSARRPSARRTWRLQRPSSGWVLISLPGCSGISCSSSRMT